MIEIALTGICQIYTIMTVKLSKLLKEIEAVEIIGETDKNIVALLSDSRKAVKDGMFVYFLFVRS